jgi:plasmid stabilization system protein ParE
MKLITFHLDADAEVTEAAQFYEARSPGLGSALLEEVQRSLAQIVTTPEAYQQIGRRVRRKPLWWFPYNLIYAIYPDRIRIVAFAHQKRRPFYWRKRLKETTGEGEGPTPA